MIGTTGLSDEVLELLGVQGAFGQCIEVPYLTEGDDVYSVLQVGRSGSGGCGLGVVGRCGCALHRDWNFVDVG